MRGALSTRVLKGFVDKWLLGDDVSEYAQLHRYVPIRSYLKDRW